MGSGAGEEHISPGSETVQEAEQVLGTCLFTKQRNVSARGSIPGTPVAGPTVQGAPCE